RVVQVRLLNGGSTWKWCFQMLPNMTRYVKKCLGYYLAMSKNGPDLDVSLFVVSRTSSTEFASDAIDSANGNPRSGR
ncbi:hypothetical protein J6590_095349, partial [Homalodisca vitripennis]